jgi:hypothetical protein
MQNTLRCAAWLLLPALKGIHRSVREREGLLAVACASVSAAGTVGKQSAKNVHDFFAQRDPDAPCAAKLGAGSAAG